MNFRFPLLLSVLLLTAAQASDMRTWRAPGSFTVRARFVSYEHGTVTLQRHDGDTLEVRLEQLTPADRREVARLAGDHARGSLPAGQMEAPTGRRELTWRNLRLGNHWPRGMSDREKDALLGLSRNWSHAESEYFILHYQQMGYARTVARQADFFYQYIAADLPGFQDRADVKSSIVVLRDAREWARFIEASGVAPEWSAAYVHGHVMYLQDTGRSRENAHVLAHEMSHLVLNRFFARPPPLWLNEGLAEWYGKTGWKAFNGQRVNPANELGGLRNPMPLAQVFSLRGYPSNPADIPRFYATSHHLVGFLMLEKDNREFVRFLQMITVRGQDPMLALREVYGFESIQALETAFHRFLR
ncbi:MAG: hypothetical protein JJU29_05480 [Verrucomicrobia bacterium]|nr:hypothetical protein [Verrucomicrobiota bacterium]MCH8512702.1 hypothetical protein [Kiritimatiellia bacterium]